jgi:23S rRNA pseudouridine2605 synthase
VIDMVPAHGERLYTVGRLDMSSEGLIVVTNDGDLANLLTHPRYGVEKTYHVEVAGVMEKEDLEQLRKGMYLAEGFAKVVHVRIKSQFKQSTLLEIVLDEGRNREIRRMLARIEHKVMRLKRVALGPLRLGELPSGHFRQLMRDEIRKLRDAAQMRSKPQRRSGGKTGVKPQAKTKREDSQPRQPTIIGGDAPKRPSGPPRARRKKASRPGSGRRPS